MILISSLIKNVYVLRISKDVTIYRDIAKF